MAKRFSKRTVRKTRIRLSPKDAENIIEQEFTSSRGDKIINRIKFRPQNPFKPDLKQTIEYKDDNNDGSDN